MLYPAGSSESQTALLAAVVENSDDAIITKDLNGVITSWNRAAQEIFGYTADEAIGRSVTMLIPLERIEEEPEILDRVRRGEKVDHYETVRQRKDGSKIDISLTVSPLRNANGEIVGASKIARDITHRKRSHTDLEFLAAIVESSDDAIITKDLEGTITSWNRGAEIMFGYTAEEAVGRSGTILMPPERTDEEPEILERIRAGEKVDHYETIRCRKDGTRLNISLTVSPLFDDRGRVIGASKIARDIGERVRADAMLRQKDTMQRIIDAQEAERHRIARDLHDHLGQKMTGLRLMVGTMLEHCTGYDPEGHEFQNLKRLTAQIDQDISFLSWELRPTEIEVVGLPDATRSFVREWSRQYGITGDFQFYGPPEKLNQRSLSSELETHIYRIVQEALNNVLKHADASSVNVVLRSFGGELTLMVEDDGRGFDVAGAALRKTEGHHGLGLIGMTERAQLMHGTLNIDSSPGRGTTLVVSIPLEEAKSNGNGNGRARPA